MMNFKTLTMTVALGLTSAAAMAQTPPPPPPPEAKTSAMPYVMAAGMSDLYEINSSQIALQKSQRADVRKFANMLIKHHQKTTAATMKAAARANVTAPPPALDAGATQSINELQTASAGDFDRIYLAQQGPAHQAALDLHQSYSSGGDQAPLRTSARSAVPVVRQHLAAVTKLQNGKMGNMPGM
jgi:putative membrane protein